MLVDNTPHTTGQRKYNTHAHIHTQGVEEEEKKRGEKKQDWREEKKDERGEEENR